MKYIYLLILGYMTIFPTYGIEFETAVREAVERQMNTYPKSNLKDLYKNFFQDKYGPGHIVADTTSAGNYLRREMATMQKSDGELIEPTGWEGNFYRVNLSLLTDGFLSYDIFFDAFIRSVNGISAPSIEYWKKEWDEIETIIYSMNLSLPDYDKDKIEINERFQKGEYVGHHSEAFEAAYSPHYRIISRDIFENELRPLMKEIN